MNERPRKRRGLIGWLTGRSRHFWIIAAILLPPLYVAGFGPAVWSNSASRVWGVPISLFYWPLGRLIQGKEPGLIRSPLRRYASWFAKQTNPKVNASGEVIDVAPHPQLDTFTIPVGLMEWARAQRVRD
jgi:hypothetical protein